MKAKEQVGADIYIDDTPRDIEQPRANEFYTICFGNRTNAGIDPPRAKSCEEAYNMIHDFLRCTA